MWLLSNIRAMGTQHQRMFQNTASQINHCQYRPKNFCTSGLLSSVLLCLHTHYNPMYMQVLTRRIQSSVYTKTFFVKMIKNTKIKQDESSVFTPAFCLRFVRCVFKMLPLGIAFSKLKAFSCVCFDRCCINDTCIRKERFTFSIKKLPCKQTISNKSKSASSSTCGDQGLSKICQTLGFLKSNALFSQPFRECSYSPGSKYSPCQPWGRRSSSSRSCGGLCHAARILDSIKLISRFYLRTYFHRFACVQRDFLLISITSQYASSLFSFRVKRKPDLVKMAVFP